MKGGLTDGNGGHSRRGTDGTCGTQYDEAGAFTWVMINLAISTVVLLVVNMLEARQKKAVRR